jgi:hypothetical protein
MLPDPPAAPGVAGQCESPSVPNGPVPLELKIKGLATRVREGRPPRVHLVGESDLASRRCLASRCRIESHSPNGTSPLGSGVSARSLLTHQSCVPTGRARWGQEDGVPSCFTTRQTEAEVRHAQSAALGVAGAEQSVAFPRTPATPFEDSGRATRTPSERPGQVTHKEPLLFCLIAPNVLVLFVSLPYHILADLAKSIQNLKKCQERYLSDHCLADVYSHSF